MHHGTCVKHVPWCMPGLLTRGGGKNVPGIPDACAPAIWRTWQEAHGSQRLQCCRCSSRYPWTVSPSYGSRISECTQTESWDDNPRDQNWSSRLNTIHFCCRPKDHRSHPVDKEGVIITIKNTLLSFSLIKHAVKWFTKNNTIPETETAQDSKEEKPRLTKSISHWFMWPLLLRKFTRD